MEGGAGIRSRRAKKSQWQKLNEQSQHNYNMGLKHGQNEREHRE
jgi:hypothetical protein